MLMPSAAIDRWKFGMICGVVLLASSGCDRLWSPLPPAPTPEEVVELRRLNAAKRAAAVEATGPADAPSEPRERSRPLVPALQPYTDWSMAETAADALGRIGAVAVPDLIRLLRSVDAQKRWRAAVVLGRIGPDAAVAVPDLVGLLQDQDPRVCQAAARALGQIGPNAAAAVPALIRHLQESPGP